MLFAFGNALMGATVGMAAMGAMYALPITLLPVAVILFIAGLLAACVGAADL